MDIVNNKITIKKKHLQNAGNDSASNPNNNNESRLTRPMSPEASSSNRRCSSVPRTLRDHHALNNSRRLAANAVQKSTKTTNTFGEKIQNFFHTSSSKTKQQQTNQKINQLKSILSVVN